MHEMALSESLLSILEEQAEAKKFSRVKTVRLELGPWSCIEPEALLFCFDSVARGSLAEGAKIEIEHLPGKGWCWTCAETVDLGAQLGECPNCGGSCVETDRDDRMRIKDLEVQ
jgi:hydrogenase nickel incorporation protein HypA/HybF